MRPLDPRAIGETRRRLYDRDVYRGVDIESQPVADAAPPSRGPRAPRRAARRRADPARRASALPRPLRARGQRRASGPDERDRRLGVAADLESRNLFGRGANAGVALRLRRDQQVGRVSLRSRTACSGCRFARRCSSSASASRSTPTVRFRSSPTSPTSRPNRPTASGARVEVAVRLRPRTEPHVHRTTDRDPSISR